MTDKRPPHFLQTPEMGRQHRPRRRSASGDLSRPPPASNAVDLVSSGAQLRDALMTYAEENRVGQLDARSYVELAETITVQQHAHDGTPWGVCGNHAKILWVGPGGQDMVVYRGTKGTYNRGLFIEKLYFYGNGYDAAPAGACLKLSAPEGDPGSLYKFTLRDIYTAYAEYGFILEGAIFEGMGENLHAENHRRDGMAMAHTYTPGEHQGIVSNIMLMHPNMSRNGGAGIRCVQSTNIILGSFILNTEGGVVGPDGLRAIAMSNGENTGQSMLVVPYQGWGTLIHGNTASTDGVTHQPGGEPMFYLLDNVVKDIDENFNAIAYYGDGSQADQIVVVKP